MKTVKCKFKVEHVTLLSGNVRQVTLRPVSGDKNWEPSQGGIISITAGNGNLAHLTPDKEFNIEITEA